MSWQLGPPLAPRAGASSRTHEAPDGADLSHGAIGARRSEDRLPGDSRPTVNTLRCRASRDGHTAGAGRDVGAVLGAHRDEVIAERGIRRSGNFVSRAFRPLPSRTGVSRRSRSRSFRRSSAHPGRRRPVTWRRYAMGRGTPVMRSQESAHGRRAVGPVPGLHALRRLRRPRAARRGSRVGPPLSRSTSERLDLFDPIVISLDPAWIDLIL